MWCMEIGVAWMAPKFPEAKTPESGFSSDPTRCPELAFKGRLKKFSLAGVQGSTLFRKLCAIEFTPDSEIEADHLPDYSVALGSGYSKHKNLGCFRRKPPPVRTRLSPVTFRGSHLRLGEVLYPEMGGFGAHLRWTECSP